jgi:hypothetical protein
VDSNIQTDVWATTTPLATKETAAHATMTARWEIPFDTIKLLIMAEPRDAFKAHQCAAID